MSAAESRSCRSTRVWVRPELRVLVKGRPEEAVLTPCKVGWIYTLSEHDYWGGCYDYGSYDPCNSICDTLGAS